MKQNAKKKNSIFHAIFVPLIFIMILQGAIFYFAAVYGGIQDSINQNAVDILTERLTNRKNEIETEFNNDWANLNVCESQLDELYSTYQQSYGVSPFVENADVQIQYLADAMQTLIQTLRTNRVNGIFLILNDKKDNVDESNQQNNTKYGLNFRDMDPMSAYSGTEDLLLERSPSSIIDQTKCSLDSWWESVYTFSSKEEGDYYYEPIRAAWNNPDVKSEDIAYLSGIHQVSGSDQKVISYSIPLMDQEGHPYAVLGIELTAKYLSSLLPSRELNDAEKSCYILALKNVEDDLIYPISTNGSFYNRCFESNSVISCENEKSTGGFEVQGRGDISVYGNYTSIKIYNNNNPFENKQLVLTALVDKNTLFSYSQHIKKTLLLVSLFSLILGVSCIFVVSHHFAQPITALALKAKNENPEAGFHLEHLGIDEIDLLVDSIEELSKNVSKEIARTEFFSRMSHDMRTPMNAIISFSSKEMLDGADEKIKDDYLKKINESGVYLLGLINEVLDMTKIESNKVDLRYETLEATQMWETVISIVDKLAQKKDILFTRKMETPTQLYIKADEQHLNQIVINLLSNAVKFTPEGGEILLQVEMKIDNTQTNQVKSRITVRDTGIGMSEEFMQKLYHPFEQENEGNGGTGLGLSISKKLVELMGGTITCVSALGEGTTFCIALSFEKGEKPSEASDDIGVFENPKIVDQKLSGKHILLCEDHPLNTQIARKLLERKGMIVDNAVNGQEGVDIFIKKPEGTYQAVLMDIRMPILDGLGAAKAIRELDRPDAKEIPIIAMTANAFAEDMRKSRAVGMNAHLSKPIEPEKLYATLANLIK